MNEIMTWQPGSRLPGRSIRVTDLGQDCESWVQRALSNLLFYSKGCANLVKTKTVLKLS